MASGGGLSDIENLKKAAHVGQLAKDIGMKSLGALPTSDSIPISTIEGNEKGLNKKRQSPAQKFVFIFKFLSLSLKIKYSDVLQN